jgi:Na+:H+ antiporter
MSLPDIFGLLGGLLVLAFLSNRLFRTTRIPDVIVLMATGLLLGPVLHLVDARWFQPVTHFFGTLAVVLILFEGGLELDIRDTLRHFPAGLLLSVYAYILTTISVAYLFQSSQGSSFETALLVGAVLGCTSSAVILPVLQQIEVSKPVRITMLLDASISDTLAVMTVGILLTLQVTNGQIASRFLTEIAFQFSVSTVLALLAAFIWSYLLPFLSEQRFWQVLTFAAVLLLYASMQWIHANGLIAVLVFGLGIANSHRLNRQVFQSGLGAVPPGEHHAQIHHFHSELSFLVRSFFFVLIGLVVDLHGLVQYTVLVGGLVGVTAVARWVAVRTTWWAWHVTSPVERELPIWIQPRGLITVVLALGVVDARGASYNFLPQIAFAVVLLTNLLVIVGSIRASYIASRLAAAATPAPAISADKEAVVESG